MSCLRERSKSIVPCPLQALTICIALVERGTLWQMDHQAGSAGPLSDRDRELESQAVSVLGPQAAHLLQKLSEDNGVKPLVS